RIRVNGAQIPREDVVRLGEKLLELPMTLEPTMFDYCLGMALLYYKEQHCDYVVLETGLGGRLDSTNGVGTLPLVSIITRIGFDHMAYLGNTLSAIASEKAGILKVGTHAVLGVNDPEAAEVLQQTCRERRIPYMDLNEETTRWVRDYVQEHRNVLMPGTYQVENAMNAVAAIRMLYEMKELAPQVATEEILDDVILQGLEASNWPGRMQQVGNHPIFLVDGAHNPQGVRALRESLEERFPGEQMVFLMAVMADKDYEHMIEDVLPLARCFYTVTVSSDRALQGSELAERIAGRGVEAVYMDDLDLAMKQAKERARMEHCPMVAFGSLYFIGGILEKLKEDDKN
ncbi:MAG: bifunctional folylpolyglutamate synthase/dihydrofolate synthase, partial [Lachnospiraceae bacterium]|nr:bifunctional folylpolyglutamate synthase/dihydrofolate synthase [Lachnospiraceae bacterium]